MGTEFTSRSSAHSDRIYVETRSKTIRVGSREIRLNPRFYVLYCFLAICRKEDAHQNGGWVEVSDLGRLIYWHKLKPESIGKEIRRHILEIKRHHIEPIEAQQKIAGPFRLRATAKQVHFDVPLHEMAQRLGIIAVPAEPDEVNDQHSVDFLVELSKADRFFDHGKFDCALSSFTAAFDNATSAEDRVVALLKIARTKERQDDYESSIEMLNRALSHLPKCGCYRDFLLSRIYYQSGWCFYRQNRLRDAQKWYDRSFKLSSGRGDYQLLGFLYNGYALIAKQQHEYKKAHHLIQQAMSFWTTISFYSGLEMAFCNLGLIYERWAHHLENAGSMSTAATIRAKAIQWLERCIDLCNEAGIGEDHAIAEIALADLYRRCSDCESATKAAQAAIYIAEKSGNQKDLARGYYLLANAYKAAGKLDLMSDVSGTAYKRIPGQLMESLGLDFSEFGGGKA